MWDGHVICSIFDLDCEFLYTTLSFHPSKIASCIVSHEANSKSVRFENQRILLYWETANLNTIKYNQQQKEVKNNQYTTKHVKDW